jgi:glucan 1,4-alpha-glucosidase
MKKARLTLAALLAFALLVPPAAPRAQQQGNNLAPGGPGKDARWPSAGKEAVGTSNTLESKVWFTLRGGVMDEVYYPTVDVANSQTLEFVVVSRDGKRVETEERDTNHRIEVADPQALTFRQTNTAKSGAYTITKTYVTDPARPTVLVNVEFKARGGERLHVYYDPSLNNSGMHDSAWSEGRAGSISGRLSHGDGAMLSADADKASALVYSPRPKEVGHFGRTSSGYLGTSDGLAELTRKGRLGDEPSRAADGNVVQVAEIPADSPGVAQSFLEEGDRSDAAFTLALGFGREPAEALQHARQSLLKGFAAARAEYEQGWHDYVRSLRRVEAKYQPQFDMAAMVLKAHEDKTFRGAMIASLSVPWGGGASANEPVVGGYHLVWSRDLYQVATAFHALGDKASADRALDYLFRVQQKPDGSFPQNSWLDGRPFWGSLQLDEVAYPLVLAQQLGRTDNETFVKHVRPAADFVTRHGPYTPQERWEEESGYSPSTIAAEIAGLVCASEIARRNDDPASAAVYAAAADDWARNVEAWTATTSGTYGDRNYYLRVTEDDDPNDGEPRELNNGAGTFDERTIVDAGFLELVRLGIKPPADPLVAKSVAVVDQTIRVETPHGPSFYRYNHDGYGEMDDGRPWNWDGKYTGRGRLWSLLSGERGQYELARGERAAAARRLEQMLGFANEGRMLPEQVWDMRQSPRPDLTFGEGTGSATPLAWSMAQFIRLAANLQENRNLDTPELVSARYVKGPMPARANADFYFNSPELLERLRAGETLKVTGRAAKGTRAFVVAGDERRELRFDERGTTEFELTVPRGESFVLVGTVGSAGATSFHRARLRGLSAEEQRRAEGELYPAEMFGPAKEAVVSPVVEGEGVTFVYRGPARRVEVVGDFTGWRPAGLALRDAGGAGAKLIRLKFPAGTRAEYKLIADGEWILDPLNPRSIDNGVGGANSFFKVGGGVTEVAGSAGEPPSEAKALAGSALSLTTTGRALALVSVDEVPSRHLGGTRKIAVYLPPGYESSRERYPVLYVQDGTEYLRRTDPITTAERLIREKKVKPFIIVFVDPVDRTKEYWAGDDFADFMAKELVPYVDARYRTRAERGARALLGASLGGVISVWTALRHPDTFARVGGQSSAFQIDDERVARRLARLEEASVTKHPFRFYFDAGLLEPIHDVNRRVQVMLAAKGYPVTYRETPAGHNYTTWRERLADAFTALWGEEQ